MGTAPGEPGADPRKVEGELRVSFYLMVFDPEVAPREREAFLAFYERQAEWGEDHGYDDPAVSVPCLRQWFEAIAERFPPMNGPGASDDPDDPRVTDYCVGTQVIYAGFAWSQAEEAREVALDLARTHGVGFFDVSSESAGVWFPGAEGALELLHEA